MTVIDAVVDYPMLDGTPEHPRLQVVIDKLPELSQGPTRHRTGGALWTVSKYGQFICYDVEPEQPGVHNAGEFNTLFRKVYPPMIDIRLYDEDDRNYPGMALPVRTARAMMRRFDPDWRFRLFDRDAQEGRITWLPVLLRPLCVHIIEDGKWCDKPTNLSVAIRGVDAPLCQKHLSDFNRRNARKRAASSRS